MERTQCQCCQKEIAVDESMTVKISAEFKKSGKTAEEKLTCCCDCAQRFLVELMEYRHTVKNEAGPERKKPIIAMPPATAQKFAYEAQGIFKREEANQ